VVALQNIQQNRGFFWGLDGIIPAASRSGIGNEAKENDLCEGKYWLLRMIRISLKSPA
jgi:hypothetical protein